MRGVVGILCILIAVVILAGCLAGIGSPDEALQIVIESVGYGYEATLDLGSVDLEFGALSVTGAVTNISDVDLVVTSVTTSGPFGVEAPETPFTVAGGESIDVTLSFDPDVMGEAVVPLDVVLEELTVPFTLSLAGTGTAAANDVMKISIDSTDYASGASYDFGFVDPSVGAAQTPVLLVNMSDGPITVSATTGAAEDISLTLPQTPLVIAAGASSAATLEFDPTGSTESAAAIQVALEHGTAPFVLNTSGEGNYAPVAEVIVTVTDAIPTGINGEYELQSGLSPEDYRVYQLPGTDYRLFGKDTEGIRWYFDTDFDTADVAYLFTFYGSNVRGDAAGSVPSVYWDLGTGVTLPPDTIGEIDIPDDPYVWTDAPVSAHFRWADAEDDGEGATLYQWYISDTTNQFGTYTAIEGETGVSYTPLSPDKDYYLKVLVIPTATDGASPGQPVELGPVGPVRMPS
jgi:hypothetical protein